MGPRGDMDEACSHIEYFSYWICVMPSGSYACFRCVTMRTRPPNESDWVLKRRTEMVFGVQNEGGVLAGSGPGDGGLGVRKVEKVGKCSKKVENAKNIFSSKNDL